MSDWREICDGEWGELAPTSGPKREEMVRVFLSIPHAVSKFDNEDVPTCNETTLL